MAVRLSIPVVSPDNFAMPPAGLCLQERNVPIAPLSDVSVGASKHSFVRDQG